MTTHSVGSEWAQRFLLHSGIKAMGQELANVSPESQVRWAGVKRVLGRLAAIGALLPGLWFGGRAIYDRVGQDQIFRQDAGQTAPPTAETPIASVPDEFHEVQPGENPSTIAAQYNLRPQDIQAMAEEIKAQYADRHGYIHPGQEVHITPTQFSPPHIQ